jgi:predicted Co/Zn/Cd cation transporter (cation efflux family)
MMQDFDREHKVIRFGRALRVDIRYVAELMCQHELGARKVDKINSIREWMKNSC